MSRALVAAVALSVVSSVSAAERWQLTSTDHFYLQDPPGTYTFTGLYRTQGAAFNPANNEMIFSWQYGLERTDAAFNSLQRNSSFTPPSTLVPGIPGDLLGQGLNHIGDIDVYNGVIYASLDTTAGYTNGHVALYNASDLSYTGQSFELTGAPSNPHTDVASWVAVDGPAGLGYGKEWQSGNTINVYDLTDWTFSHTITMDRDLRNIQGAKVFDGALYMAADNDTASIYRVDLLTGHVDEIAQLPLIAGQSNEVEGIAVRTLPDGTVELLIENIIDPNNSGQDLTDPDLHVDLLHYTLVPAPGAAALLIPGFIAAARRRRA